MSILVSRSVSHFGADHQSVSDQNLPMVNLLAICTIRPGRCPHPAAKPLRPTGDSRLVTINAERSSDYSARFIMRSEVPIIPASCINRTAAVTCDKGRGSDYSSAERKFKRRKENDAVTL